MCSRVLLSSRAVPQRGAVLETEGRGFLQGPYLELPSPTERPQDPQGEGLQVSLLSGPSSPAALCVRGK